MVTTWHSEQAGYVFSYFFVYAKSFFLLASIQSVWSSAKGPEMIVDVWVMFLSSSLPYYLLDPWIDSHDQASPLEITLTFTKQVVFPIR